MAKIKETAIESIIIASKQVYPNEFISMLGVNEKNEITELVIFPSVYGKNYSSIRADLMPFDRSIVGTIHSHPSPNNFPSAGDLKVFSALGKIHLIICWPFNLNSIKAFDSKGKETILEVIR
ncbi:MAG: Mov34/MPN/PAD-1 family protein [archaeon]